MSSIDSEAVSWTVDSVANASTPVLELTSQYATNAEGVVYANTARPSLSGSTEAGAKVEVYDNGALWQTVTADASGRWVLSAAALPNPTNGTAHAITTVVTDVTGNVSGRSSALNFTLLTTAPTAPVASILAGGDSGISSTDGMTNITTQTITGTVNLVAGLDTPTVLVYDNGQLIGSVRADATGAWSFTATGLATGGHVLTVRAKDVAGNLSAATLVTSLTVDTTAPTALTVNLASGEDTGTSASDGLTYKTRPQVSGTAEAAATVELYVDGILAATTLADASTGAFSLQPTEAISQGYHALTLVQVDAAGNRSAVSNIKPINVDSAIGAVTNLSLVASDVVYTSAGEFVTNKPKPTVKGFGEAGASVTIYSGSNPLGTTTVGVDGQWSITLTADLSASNSLTATQTDAAGNTSAASAALKVAYSAAASAPTVALQTASDTGVQGDGITSSTRPFLVGAGAANGDSIELYNSDSLVGSATADDAGNWAVIGYNGVPTVSTPTYGQGDTLIGGGGKDSFKWLSLQLMNSDAVDKITDFGLEGGSGAGQGANEADVLDLSALLKGYNAGSLFSDFIQAVNLNGKVQVQADFDGKANGSAFEKTWFMTLDNLSVNANNEVLVNNATVAATAPGLTGNVTTDTLVQQMMADSQFKVL